MISGGSSENIRFYYDLSSNVNWIDTFTDSVWNWTKKMNNKISFIVYNQGNTYNFE